MRAKRRASDCRDKLIDIMSEKTFLTALNGKRVSRAAVDLLRAKYQDKIDEQNGELVDLGLMMLAGSVKGSLSALKGNKRNIELPLSYDLFNEETKTRVPTTVGSITPIAYFKNFEKYKSKDKATSKNSKTRNLHEIMTEMKESGNDHMTLEEYLKK